MSSFLKGGRVCLFGADRRGNLTVIAAIAIDMQMAVTQKTKVQAVIECAVIAGSKAMQSGWNRQEISMLIDQSTGKRFFYCEQASCASRCSYSSNRTIAPKRRWFETNIGENTCVSERVGARALTDAVGGTGATNAMIAGNPLWNRRTSNDNKRNGSNEIEHGGANCSSGAFNVSPALCENSAPLPPLTENKATLKSCVDNLHAGGGTAGHLGIARGWYLILPNWNALWPTPSHPWAQDEPGTAKAIILMTDGEFNQTHCSVPASSIELAMEFLRCNEAGTVQCSDLQGSVSRCPAIWQSAGWKIHPGLLCNQCRSRVRAQQWRGTDRRLSRDRTIDL